MTAARVLVFALVFCLDVHVRASTLGLLRQPVEEPRHCMSRSEICVVGTYKGTKYDLNVGAGHLILGSDTAVTRVERTRFILLHGDLWVRTEDVMTVESEYGTVSVDHGEALISRQDKRLLAKNLSGTVKLFPKGGTALGLDRGFENSLSAVGKDGQSQTGIPQLLDLKATLGLLGQLYTGDKADFAKLASDLFGDWSSRVAAASEFQENLAKRAIASDEASATVRLRREQAAAAERARLRRLFREKTLEE
jgi:hypothetical protein